MFAALDSASEDESEVVKAEDVKKSEKAVLQPPGTVEEEGDFSVTSKKKRKGKGKGKGGAAPRKVRCQPGTQAYSDELMLDISRSIDAALRPFKAPLAAKIRGFIGAQDPLAGQTIPVSFRSTTLARGMDDRWHAEFHLRGPMKCFYEAVQTAGSVKTKSGFRQNANICQLEGYWRRGVRSIHIRWTKETRRFNDATTRHANETTRDICQDVELHCYDHSCGAVYLQGHAEDHADGHASGKGRTFAPPTFWLAPKGFRCSCGCPCCCNCVREPLPPSS